MPDGSEERFRTVMVKRLDRLPGMYFSEDVADALIAALNDAGFMIVLRDAQHPTVTEGPCVAPAATQAPIRGR